MTVFVVVFTNSFTQEVRIEVFSSRRNAEKFADANPEKFWTYTIVEKLVNGKFPGQTP